MRILFAVFIFDCNSNTAHQLGCIKVGVLIIE